MRFNKKNPLLWVPSVYFAMGLPFVALSLVSVLIFKDLGVPNEEITLWTSLLTFPYSLKWLFSPLMETLGTKRKYIIFTEIASAILFGVIIFALPLPNFFTITLALMAAISVSGSMHDIAGNGVYMEQLDTETQSIYSGWQGAFYNLAKILANGGLVFLAGWLTSKAGYSQVMAWQIVMALFAIIMCAVGVYHWSVLPNDIKKETEQTKLQFVFTKNEVLKLIILALIGFVAWYFDFKGTPLILCVILMLTLLLFTLVDILAPEKGKEMRVVFKDFFKKKYIFLYLIFIFLYRFAEGLALKVAPIMLKDPISVGGIGLNNKDYGLVYGTFGTGAFILGSILSGYYISKFGLKKTLFSLVCIFNIPFVVFLLFALYIPQQMWIITTGIVFEYFSYGFGFVGIMLFMMQQMAPGKYQMAHLAFADSLMNLGVMVPGMISGYLSKVETQTHILKTLHLEETFSWLTPYLGYPLFFMMVMVATLPVIFLTKFVPFTYDDSKK